jgi:hypothetical protein
MKKSINNNKYKINNFPYKKKQHRPPSKKKKRGKKPKPEEQEGMPQHRHCPHATCHGDRNPKYHEEEQKDVI